MQFRSKSQQRWAHTPFGEKALGGAAAVHEWDEATNFKRLPEKVMSKHIVNLGKKGSFKVAEGSLHRMLGIPEGEKIGEERLKKAAHSETPAIRRKAIAGIGLSHMKHGK